MRHRRSHSQQRSRRRRWQARRRCCASACRAWSLFWRRCGCARARLSACACCLATRSLTRRALSVVPSNPGGSTLLVL